LKKAWNKHSSLFQPTVSDEYEGPIPSMGSFKARPFIILAVFQLSTFKTWHILHQFLLSLFFFLALSPFFNPCVFFQYLISFYVILLFFLLSFSLSLFFASTSLSFSSLTSSLSLS
jgi:hypothetical protein